MAGRSLAVGAAPAQAQAQEQPARRPDEPHRIRELDGIRAIAITSVLVAHAAQDDMPALHALQGWHANDWVLIGHLWLGVDLFFVLSGFLITGILLESREDRRYYQNFYVRRALRILPVLFVFLGLIAAVYHGPLAYFALALLFCANFATYLNVDAPPGAGPLWSLGVEEQFYLLWPTVVRRFLPKVVLWFAVAICIAVPFFRALAPDPSRDLALTWMRCDGLALGALVATWVYLERRRPALLASAAATLRNRALTLIAGLVGLALVIWCVETLLHVQHISRALRPTEADLVFGAAILTAYAWQGAPAMALLRSPLATFIAGTSYCAYIIHLSVYNAIDAWGWTASSVPIVSAGLRLLWGIPIIFALAALSKRFLEDPILRLKSKFAPRESAT
jgi:peptidoglycan/LPS O-acetylase OafA/YrhL